MSKIKRIIRKLKSFSPVMNGTAQVSFSQFGEDIIMLKMLERYKVKNITYFDIGANDPINGSNTYNFYLRGYRGVLVEPNIDLCKKIQSVRPDDKVLNFGIANGSATSADYYMFEEAANGMNTFSKKDAENYERDGFPIKRVLQLPLKDINEVLAENFTEAPTIVSIDVEGLDELILEKLDYSKYRPLLICVEAVDFSKAGELKKRTEIFDLLEKNGYFVYADTHVNAIFCSKERFAKLNEQFK
jgi:FkbM family methyltransferase